MKRKFHETNKMKHERVKFREIIKDAAWLSVELVLLKLYPDEKKNISGYEEVFNKLKIMPVEESNISILVSNEIDDFDNTEYNVV